MFYKGKDIQSAVLRAYNPFTRQPVTGIAANLTPKISYPINFNGYWMPFATAAYTEVREIGRGFYGVYFTPTECNVDGMIVDADCSIADVAIEPAILYPNDLPERLRQDTDNHLKAKWFSGDTLTNPNPGGNHPADPLPIANLFNGNYSLVQYVRCFIKTGAGNNQVTLAANQGSYNLVFGQINYGNYEFANSAFEKSSLVCLSGGGYFLSCTFKECTIVDFYAHPNYAFLSAERCRFDDCSLFRNFAPVGALTWSTDDCEFRGLSYSGRSDAVFSIGGSGNVFIDCTFGPPTVQYTLTGHNNTFINCAGGTWTDSGTGNRFISWNTDATLALVKAQTDKLRFNPANRVLTETGATLISGGGEGFRFGVRAVAAEGRVLSGIDPEVDDAQILDATFRTTTYTTSPSVGTQWRIETQVIQHDPHADPPLAFSSSDEAVAVARPDGSIEYRGDGEATIAVSSPATAESVAQRNEVRIVNSHAEAETYQTTQWIADPVSIAAHVLIAFNAEDAESIEVKDYYRAHRPGMSAAHVLALTGCPAVEYTSQAVFEASIRPQVVAYLQANPSIRYVVLCRGIPTRYTVDGGNWYFWNGEVASVGFGLSDAFRALGIRSGAGYQNGTNRFSLAEYQNTCCLCTHLDMGSVEATKAYIDKIAARPSIGPYLSGNSAGRRWVLDNEHAYPSGEADMTSRVESALLAEGVPAGEIAHNPDGQPPVTSAADVGYYQSWGVHSSLTGDYAKSGEVVFSGQSDWYLVCTIESFNGVLGTSQADWTDWFSAGAFGGVDYSNTPVGAVGHTAEPTGAGVNDEWFARLWARGWPLIECAWQSRNCQHFLCVGDPLVVR